MSSQRQTRSSARQSQRTSARLASMAAVPSSDAEPDYEPEHDDAWSGQGLRRSSRRISSRVKAAEPELLPRRSLRSRDLVKKVSEPQSEPELAIRRRSTRITIKVKPPAKSRKAKISVEDEDEEEEDPELANLVDAAAAPSDSNDGSFEEDGEDDDDDEESSSESEDDDDEDSESLDSDSQSRYSRRRQKRDRRARRQSKQSRKKQRLEHKTAVVKQKMKPSKDCLPEDPLWQYEPTYPQPEAAADLTMNDPAVAFIVIYTTKFASVFVGIDPIGPQDIEEGLEKGHGQTELLFRRILGLCLNRKKELESEKYLSAMNELHTLISHMGRPARFPDDLPWKSKTVWQDIDSAQRLSLLFGLFQLSLASSQQVQALLGDLSEDDMQPWFGVDNENARYYFVQGNGDTPFRFYKESSPLLRTVRWESIAGSHSEASSLGKRLCESEDDAEKEIGQYIIELLPYLEETEDRRYKELRKQRRRHDIELQVEQVRAGEGRYAGRTRGARVDYSMKTYERSLDRAIQHKSNTRSSARVAARDDRDSTYMAEPPRNHGIRQSRRVRGEVPMDLDAPSYQELLAEEEAKKIAEAEEAERQEQQRLEEKRLRKEALQQKRAANKEKARQKGAAVAAENILGQSQGEQPPQTNSNPFTILRGPSASDDHPISPRSAVPAPSQVPPAMPGLRPNMVFGHSRSLGQPNYQPDRSYVPQQHQFSPLAQQPAQQPTQQPIQQQFVPQLNQGLPRQLVHQLPPMQPQEISGSQQAIPYMNHGSVSVTSSSTSQINSSSPTPSTAQPSSISQYSTLASVQNSSISSMDSDSQRISSPVITRLPQVQAVTPLETETLSRTPQQLPPMSLPPVEPSIRPAQPLQPLQPAPALDRTEILQTAPPLDIVRTVTPPLAVEPLVAPAMPLPTPPIAVNTPAALPLAHLGDSQEPQFVAQPSPLPSHRPTPEAEEQGFIREQ